MADGFLGRWARRKEAVRKGEEVAPEPEQPKQPPSPPPMAPEKAKLSGDPASAASGRGSEPAARATAAGSEPAVTPSPHRREGQGEGAAAENPPPTLEDAQSLTKDSDFTRFTKPDVPPDVKTAAFKKLFADPHFNVMDGLDVYIDDYSKPDPIPPEMLRNLASAKFLKLFDEEEKKEDEQAQAQAEPTVPREVADASGPQDVAQSGTRTEHELPPAEDHADPDLRLQQDDAPGRRGPGEESR